jgi:LmbE family N-acetylglucosaminyl deacetylase
MSKTVCLFISPHLDDVALSCGGYISRLTAHGEQVVIATMITADAPAEMPLSRGMRWRHMVWGLGNTPFAMRCREDAAATANLRAQYLHLGLLDAIYRHDANGSPLYPKKLVHVPVHPDDLMNYVPIIRQKFKQLLDAWVGWETRIFCPLSLGGHVDHILVRSAVEGAYGSENLTYYEDYPYVTRSDSNQPQSGLNGIIKKWGSTTFELTPAEIEARITAVANYVSQIPILFPSTSQRCHNHILYHIPLIGRYLNWSTDKNASRQRITLALQSYLARVGGERYWSEER